MILRQVKESDFDTIYDIYMDETVNPFMLHDPVDKKDFRAIFNTIMARDYFWVVEKDGRTVGMCSVVVGKGRCSHVASVYSLGIKKEAQGGGIGRKLMHEIISVLQGRDITRLELGVESDNARGIAFYKALGFTEEGRLKNYLKRQGESHFIDEILMARMM